jgi:hypothetical protein
MSIQSVGPSATSESLAKHHNLAGYSRGNVNLFFKLLNRATERTSELTDSIIRDSGGKITMPMETIYLENYLSGYNFEYIPFNNVSCGIPQKEGLYRINKQTIRIFYNTNNCNIKRQRYSKVHELWHVCQLFDLEFREAIDYLMEKTNFPPELIVELIEKSANKATAIYLMPNDYFIRKYNETQNIRELSDYFQVSIPSIMYRMKECGLIPSY